MSLELHWDELPAPTWQALLAAAPRSGLQQDWGYGRTVAAAGHTVRRVAVCRGGSVVALAQLVERQLLGLVRIVLLMRGPVWLVPELRDALEPELIARLRAELGRAVLLWTPERGHVGERLCGLRRVMTGYSTIWLDLSADPGTLRAKLHGKWRNRLVRAEEAGLEVRIVRQGPLREWLLQASEAHRARVGFRAPPPAFVRSLAEPWPGAPRAQSTLVALERGEPVAGMLVQPHGSCATYLVAATTPRGRELRAHHLLLWRAVTLLKEEGVRALDLGGIDTVGAPGLARFKLGLGGTVLTMAGTFLGTPTGLGRPAAGFAG